ncbi:hypothetical protein HHK36_029006 [Tetracentron sinense]|uniref:Mechanosensitive ion channel MscS domain-containing protein n=1 Tax=Tetracentron sinense TaxID=13715 RepID=A0A834YCI2_TETSI|nr:hypothetical protein HHK36_029006 [Tetracentron sinense]
MAGARFSILRSFYTSVNPTPEMRSVRSCNSCINSMKFTSFFNVTHNHRMKDSNFPSNLVHAQFRMLAIQSSVDIPSYRADPIAAFSPRLSHFHHQSSIFPILMSTISNCRAYSSYFGGKGNGPRDPEVPAASVASDSNGNNTGVVGSDWVDSVKHAWQSAVDAAAYTEQKAKEASDVLTPHVQQLLDSHPYLRNFIIPVGGTLTATMLAWLVMPRLLRRFHTYSMQGPVALLSGSLPQEQFPYEKSFWGALEDPVRYLITFMAFSQIGMIIAPTTIASQYLAQAWRGAVIVSFVWFLHRWKTNVFTRALVGQNKAGLDRERLLALDKLSSVGLFVLGLMALAEACGVAVQSIITVGGIGGVATAFAARDILGNVLSGLSMQFSKPFSLGDTIKAGSIEGQVVEMGLTTTSLLNAEKFPVIVPNSLFSSQVIVNKSRAQWRAIITKIPIRIDNLEKVPQISEDIKSMLKSNSKIFLGKEAPYCFLSRIESSYAELTVGGNLKHMNKDELYSTEQDILLQSVRIIKQHGEQFILIICEKWRTNRESESGAVLS